MASTAGHAKAHKVENAHAEEIRQYSAPSCGENMIRRRLEADRGWGGRVPQGRGTGQMTGGGRRRGRRGGRRKRKRWNRKSVRNRTRTRTRSWSIDRSLRERELTVPIHQGLLTLRGLEGRCSCAPCYSPHADCQAGRCQCAGNYGCWSCNGGRTQCQPGPGSGQCWT